MIKLKDSADGLFSVLPVPPLEQLRVMLGIGGVIDRTTQYIEHAPIDGICLIPAEFLIKLLGIFAFEIIGAANPDFA